jgi:hypothetical protein
VLQVVLSAHTCGQWRTIRSILAIRIFYTFLTAPLKTKGTARKIPHPESDWENGAYQTALSQYETMKDYPESKVRRV